nr:phosphorylase [uncultured Faecalibacterium sp.]
MDGANVEIANLVGPENIFTFGMSSDEVIAHYTMEDYDPKLWLQRDNRLADAIEFLIGPEMTSAGDETCLRRLHDNLVHKDYFMTLPDFESYCSTKDDILTARENETGC